MPWTGSLNKVNSIISDIMFFKFQGEQTKQRETSQATKKGFTEINNNKI